MRVYPWLICLWAGIVACQPAATPPVRPNVVVIFSDELAPEYLGSYGGTIPTPELDRLAAGGLRFTQAYVPASMCTPSRYALLTGQYPGRCTGAAFLDAFPTTAPYSVAWNTALDTAKMTLPRWLGRQGYHTAMIGKWHLNPGQALPAAAGLQAGDDPADPAVDARLRAHQAEAQAMVRRYGGFDEADAVVWSNYDDFPVHALRYHHFEWVNAATRRFLRRQAEAEEPFFLYLATTAVHGPAHQSVLDRDPIYTLGGVDSSLAGHRAERAALAAAVAGLPPHEQHLRTGLTQLDTHVGAVLAELEALGLRDRTLVIFMADHNTEPAKATCYQKGVQVPLLVSGPGIPAGSPAAIVQSVDLLPTLAGWLDLPLPEGTLDGQSFAAVLADPAAPGRDYAYFEAGYARAVTDGQYSYQAFRLPGRVADSLRQQAEPFAPNYLNTFKQAHSQIAIEAYPAYFAPDQLYDLQQDPYQQVNRYGDPALAAVQARLRGYLEQELSGFAHPYPLADTAFFYDPAYAAMAARTRGIGTAYIGWWKRDHGDKIWPPVR